MRSIGIFTSTETWSGLSLSPELTIVSGLLAGKQRGLPRPFVQPVMERPRTGSRRITCTVKGRPELG